MVREFYLLDENDNEFSLMDIYNYTLLTEPSGLGYGYDAQYEIVNNTFITNLRKIQLGQIIGTVNFLNYENYTKFIDFIEAAQSLRFKYRVPYEERYKEYFKDVNLQSITKSQKQQNGIISESVSFDCLSLWYQPTPITVSIDPSDSNINLIKNTGHVPAPVEITLVALQEVVNPKIDLYIDDELYQSVPIKLTMKVNEKLLYGTKDNDFHVNLEHTDGTLENLFSLANLTFNNDNVIRLPTNKTSKLKISSEKGFFNQNILAYPEFKAV